MDRISRQGFFVNVFSKKHMRFPMILQEFQDSGAREGDERGTNGKKPKGGGRRKAKTGKENSKI